MDLEFEGLYDQQFDSDMFLDSNGSQDLWDFFTYPVMLWDLPNNTNEGMNLGNFSLDGALENISAEEKALLLQQFSKSPSQRQQLEVQQSLQDSNYNSPTNSRVSPLNTESLSSVGKKSTSEDGERHKLESCSSHPTQQKQKQKVCWTPELHALFVKAVEQLGIYNAVPTKILELMGVHGLTRHNIASHLQKYRATVRRLRGNEALGLGEGTRRRKPRRQHLMRSLLNKTHHVLEQQKQQQLSPAATTGGMSPVAGAGIYAHFTPRLQFWGPSAHVFSRQQFNHFGGHQWPSQQPSGYRPILPAATAAYEQSFVRYPTPTVGLHHSAAAHKEALCSVDSEAHIDSTAVYHPENSAVVEAVKEVLSNPCSHSPIGLIPPSLDTRTTTTRGEGG